MTYDWIPRFAATFGHDSYLFWSRIEGTAWTLADLVIVFYLLRTANICRRFVGARPHRLSYVCLALTVPFAALIPFSPNATAFFRLELVVTVPHFLLILYVLLLDLRHGVSTLSRLVREVPPDAPRNEGTVDGTNRGHG